MLSLEVGALGKQYSRRELIKIALQKGWDVNESRGKGSHSLATKQGERPFPIPYKISSGVHDSIKKRLGIKD